MDMKRLNPLAILVLVLLIPTLGFADVDSTLTSLRTFMTNRLIPLFAALGLCYAGLNFTLGKPEAKTQLMYAIFGTIIGFLAPAIITLLSGLAN